MLRQPPQPPPLFTATAASILQDAEALVERTRQVYDQLTATVSPDTATFSNVIQPLAHAENARIQGYRILTFYSSVSPNIEIREASRKARVLLEAFVAEIEMRDDLFALVDAVASKTAPHAVSEDGNLDPESRYLVTRLRQDFATSGLELRPGPARERFREIRNRIEELAGEIKKNIAEADAGIWLTPRELEGVPESELSKLTRGQGENEGKLRLRANTDDLGSVLRNARGGDTRRRVKICRANRCDRNMPLLKEVFVLRDEAARLLGRPNHAALRMEEKIAKTPAKVNDFLSSLQSKFAVAGRQHIEKLKEVKRRDVESRGEAFDGLLFSWDEPYCERLLEDDMSEPEGPRVSEFFPLESTVVGMLGMFERLFDLRFFELLGADRDELSPSGNGAEIVWSDNVRVYAVWDAETEDDNSFLGYLYLDLYSRDGKSQGVFDSNLVPGFVHGDGTRQYPSTAMICNYPVPTPEKPSLLGHWPVVLVFHELGHAIHDLVSKTRYARFHGPAGTHVDFGEFPSQMLENWCWIPEQLNKLSRHYSYLSPTYLEMWRAENQGRPQPPERIPDELIETIVRPDQPNHSALHYLQQLRLCIFDMTVHQPEGHDDMIQMNISEMWNNLQTSLCLFDDELVPGRAGRSDGWTSFGHLVNDYDVGYYSYLFSNVFSADVFRSVFRASPMNTQKGKEYRQAVLEKGGSQDGMEILRAFLGREPVLAPFYEEIGLAAS